MTYEHYRAPLLSRPHFLQRVIRNAALAGMMAGAALLVGMFGYHFLEHLAWIDAFANAAMILSGMGPLNPLATTSGKLFAGCYALFSGLMFITLSGLILAPFAHRIMHRLHISEHEH